MQLLDSLELPDGIVVHSKGVARVAVEAARLVAAAGVPIDVRLVEVAALLHDIDKLETRGGGGVHGQVAAERLAEMGYVELTAPVASHPVTCLLDDRCFPRGWPSVIVSVADRHVAQDFLSIDERIDDMQLRHPEYAAGLDAARRPAHALEAELADGAGLQPDELVQRLRGAWEAGA
jgi:putative nucleotidyltransferase with HDIG domain